ncbi:ABC transporter permease [Deferribacter abyssi]|uniref:ABC transporter permease n=1 Tax=Deferribacter abyssi TaxID=213806 RepID=UPI003C23475E
MLYLYLTFRSVIKDRIFLIIVFLVFIYGLIPVFSYFSMRQVQEISITMSLTLNSFILLFLSLFGGISTIWRDIERKYTYTLLSYPVTRISYLVGRYFGFVLLLLLITILNFSLSVIVIKISAGFYKSQLPIIWLNIFGAFAFSFLKYCLLLAFGFLFASFSTSFFTPIFSTVAIFIAGNSIQGIFDYVMKEADKISVFVKSVVKLAYYILPNFSAFDLTSYATYALQINGKSIIFTLVYFLFYLTIVLSLTVIIFNRRDLT